MIGSLIDSLLGATVQLSLFDKSTMKVYSGIQQVRDAIKAGKIKSTPGKGVLEKITGLDVMDNHQVNLVSSLITAMLSTLAYYHLFFRI